MRVRCSSAAVAAFAVAAAMVPGALFAQDGTPPASQSRVPAPEECQIEPRTADNLLALLDPAVAAETVAEFGDIPVPLGELADAETADALNLTARELLACINAGDLLRISALFTDDAVGPALGPAPEEPSDLATEAVPLESSDQARLIAVTDISLLADGRAAAFLVLNDPQTPPGGSETVLLVFEQTGDRWLIDRLIDFSVLSRPPGTPTAEGTPEA